MPANARVRSPNLQPTTADVHVPGSIGGQLKDGIELSVGEEVVENFVCGGAARVRVRVKITTNGTLQLRWLRSVTNRDIPYEAGQPVPVALTANIEAMIDIPSHMGEGRGQVSITPSGDGEVVFCDVLIT